MGDFAPLTQDQLIDKIYKISGFLVGYGEAAEMAAAKLRELVREIETKGIGS